MRIYLNVLILALLFLGIACENPFKKFQEIPSLPEIEILNVSTCNNIVYDIEIEVFSGTTNLKEFGFCWSTSADLTIEDSCVINMNGTSTFVGTLIKENPKETIFVRAFATAMNDSICYSETVELFGVEKKWANLGAAPIAARVNPVAFEINNNIYLGLGGSGLGEFLNDFYKYDPLTCNWDTLDDFRGSAREGATGFVIGDKIYVGTGAGKSFEVYNDFYAYDINIDRWEPIAPLPDTTGGRKQAFGFSLNGKGYILTGCGMSCSTDTLRKDVWEYTPGPSGGNWIPKNDFFGDPRGGARGFLVDNQFYFGLGFMKDENNKPLYKRDFWKYIPENDSWAKLPELIGPGRGFFTGFVLNNKIYFGLGEEIFKNGSIRLFDDFYVFDPDNNSDPWTRCENDFFLEIAWNASASVEDIGYIFFGAQDFLDNNTYKNNIWQFVP